MSLGKSHCTDLLTDAYPVAVLRFEMNEISEERSGMLNGFAQSHELLSMRYMGA